VPSIQLGHEFPNCGPERKEWFTRIREAAYKLIFTVLCLVSTILVLAIIAVVFPLWASLKVALLLFVGKAKLALWFFMTFCTLLIIQEYLEELKYAEPKSDGPAAGLQAGPPSFNYSRHQRNMYLFVIPVILAVILKILISLLPGFVQELSDLQEQIEVKQKTAGKSD
jgi:hypothetical protein